MVREETAGEGRLMPWPTPAPSCSQIRLSLAPRPARLPTPEAGACHSGSRLRGLPCAGQGWVRGPHPVSDTCGHPGTSGITESPGRFPLL